MEDKLDRIEHAVAEMRAQMASGFASVEEQFAAVRQELREEIRQGDAETRHELSAQMSAQIGSLRQELREEIRQGDAETRSQLSAQIGSVREALREEIRHGNGDTRSQLSAQIESLRDDVRIFAEAHVALEQRVTRLEDRQR